jgi:hypothetical protein
MLVGMSTPLKIINMNIYTHNYMQEVSDLHMARSDLTMLMMFCYQEASDILHQVIATKSGFLVDLGGMFYSH